MTYRYIPPELAAHFRQPNYNIGLFFRIAGAAPVRVVLGFSSMEIRSEIPPGLESIDPEGTVYHAIGTLHEMPDVDSIFNGIAQEVRLKCSGFSGHKLEELVTKAPSFVGREVRFGMAPLDENWQPKSMIKWMSKGHGDFVVDEMEPPTDLTKETVHSLTLVMMFGETSRSKQPLAYYSDADQQAQSPGDLACIKLPRYVQGYRAVWPRGLA